MVFIQASRIRLPVYSLCARFTAAIDCEGRSSLTLSSPLYSTSRILVCLQIPMEVFNGAHEVSIQTATINSIHGNQANTFYNQIVERKEREYTKYDEYHSLISGDVYRLQEVHREVFSPRILNRNGEMFCQKACKAGTMVCHAEIRGRRGFTAVYYQGQDAKKLWEEDFQQFTEEVEMKNIQLFGINRHSKIPFLIFYGELIPLAHIAHRIKGCLSIPYLWTLVENWNCQRSQLWINPDTGALISGVPGPHIEWLWGTSRLSFCFGTLRPHVEFLQNHDVLWHYLSQLPLQWTFDNAIVKVLVNAYRNLSLIAAPNVLCPNQLRPMVFSTLTNSTLAIGHILAVQRTLSACNGSSGHYYFPEIIMSDGTVRFELAKLGSHNFTLFCDWNTSHTNWLLEATSVFHQLGVSLDEDLSQFRQIDCSEIKFQWRQQLPPIYLFILPDLPLHSITQSSSFISQWHGWTFVSQLHYWSLDPNGQTSIPGDICRCLGLPTQLILYNWKMYQHSYSTEAYKNIHQWQVSRGFDPRTADFACYMTGLGPVFEVIQTHPSHFTELSDRVCTWTRGKWLTLYHSIISKSIQVISSKALHLSEVSLSTVLTLVRMKTDSCYKQLS
ncbi:hypothetical protein L218DRAFT_987433 [Marasmius fiardii PR-910]|nr:hypothetical protein L218DRAFT_987433 [Marasmius fiardii PR-910]